MCNDMRACVRVCVLCDQSDKSNKAIVNMYIQVLKSW